MLCVRVFSVVLACLLLNDSVASARPQTQIPSESDANLSLIETIDLNPNPTIVEVDLTARIATVELNPGLMVDAWTYNGSIPGPLIRAKIGDRLIVHFRNELPQPTTVHWHGMRVPIGMDGVPGISQEQVDPGEAFIYDFVARDPGLYWYHPHIMSAAQVGYGLYGAVLVEDSVEGPRLGVADELVMVLSDLSADDKGRLEAADTGGPAGMVFGREGAHVLVNGRIRPHIRARAGVPQRWRIVNAAKSRFFMLELDGQQFVQMGTDGGLQEYAVTLDSVLVTPGERVDLIVIPRAAAGTQLTLRSALYNRGYGSTEFRGPEELMTMELTEGPLAQPPALPALIQPAAIPSVVTATRVDLLLTLSPMDASGQSEFRINGVPSWKAQPYRASIGETQLWTVRNDTEWDHPFHLHGFFFTVLDANHEPIRPLARKDTVNVPRKSVVNLLVAFDERPGEWMFHCHILDHADGGLMGTVLVGDVLPSPHVH
jgi:FtsP/CotA-like multicopper oxidase with cupredoxin domain